MSYDLTLLDPVTRQPLETDEPHHMHGGTYRPGGTTELHLNVTFNYSAILGNVLDNGIRGIYGMTGSESIPLLQKAASSLKDNASDDYWEPTEGNVKRALLQLVALARMRPDGEWDGD